MSDGSQPGAGLPFEIELARGKGLLDARALWASVVGPHRLAAAKGSSVQLSNSRAEEVARNMGASDALMFVGVALPGANPAAAPVSILFSRMEMLGVNASAPFNVNGQMGGGGFGQTGFMQLLLPGEQLFAQIAPGGPAALAVVVAQVQF